MEGCEVDQHNMRLLVDAARDLASDGGHNTEYDRALVELIATFVPGERDKARLATEQAVLGTEHRVEEVAKVYLLWDNATQRWVIDESCAPEMGPLDGYPAGASGQECECEDRATHHEVVAAAQLTSLPNLTELADMITARSIVT